MSEFKKQTEEFMKKHPVGFAGTCREITTAIFGLPITSKTPEWKKMQSAVSGWLCVERHGIDQSKKRFCKVANRNVVLYKKISNDFSINPVAQAEKECRNTEQHERVRRLKNASAIIREVVVPVDDSSRVLFPSINDFNDLDDFLLNVATHVKNFVESKVRGLADYSREELLCEYRQRNGLIR